MLRQRQQGDERGVIAIEFMLTITMLLVVFMVMLQYALKAHAQHVANAAAEEALAAATAYDGTTSAGHGAATDYLDRLGPGLSNPVVSVSRTPITATVTISGDVEQLIPLLPVHVTVRTQGPVEHFVQAQP
jgi:Flp pilus assembly protein TadG